MSTAETSRFVRLRVELVLEVTDAGELTGAALERIDEDEFMPDDERGHALAAVQGDEPEALAYLVDPVDLVSNVPGVELAQASWSSEHIQYDPASGEWDLGLGDEDDDPDDADDLDESGFIHEDEERPKGEGGAGRA
jgi:hypothetical protein